MHAVCLQENVLERQTDGLSLSLWRDLKDQRGWKGRRKGGGRENGYHGDYDITRGLCALPQWEFCVCGGEGKQQSWDDRRRHFVKFKWQKCGRQSSLLRTIKNKWRCFFVVVFFQLLSLPPLCISLPWAAAVTDLCYVNTLITQCGCVEVNCMFQSARSFLTELLLWGTETEEMRKRHCRQYKCNDFCYCYSFINVISI